MKVVSDTHFFHTKIILWSRTQFKTIEDMHEAIIAVWNSKVAKDETVYHLGDFAFGDDLVAIENLIKRLNGNITLILGNHDTARKIKELYVKYFKCVGSLVVGKYYLTHEPIHFEVINPAYHRETGRQATINVHGHVHDGRLCSDKHINCCLDVVGIENLIQELED